MCQFNRISYKYGFGASIVDNMINGKHNTNRMQNYARECFIKMVLIFDRRFLVPLSIAYITYGKITFTDMEASK